MAQFVNESFTGTPGENLTLYNGWAKVPGAAGDAFITSGGDHVRFSGATLYYLGDFPAPGADYSATVDIDITSTTSGPGVGVALRLMSTAQTYYLVRLLSGTGIQMYRVVNGASSLMGSAPYTVVAGARLSLRGEVSGTTINAYLDGATVPAITATDAQITAAGYVGLRAINATTQIQPDNLIASTPEAAGIDGALSSSLSGASITASGIQHATGATSSTLAGASLASSGAASSAPSGSLVSALSGASANMAGLLANPGALSSNLAGAAMSAAGALMNAGAWSSTLSGAGMSATGSLAMNAVATLDSSLDGAVMYAGGYVGEPPEMAQVFQRLPKNPRHFQPLQ